MTVEQKAKAYDEALERASKLRVQNPFDTVSQMMEHVFPELKESEDEKIKRFLICGMHAIKEQKKKTFATIPIDDVIAWLKKQSEKQGKSALEAIKEEKVDNSNKVESKFHEGEWVVSNFTGFVYQIKTCIENITNHTYSYDLTTDGCIGIDEVNHYHLWTIQDAKDGDVLTWDDSQCIVLFKNIEDELTFNGHGCVGHCTGVFEAGWSYHDIEGAHPATKEQRDTLFAKMKEAGYEWDSEKKELKKIEQKPAWSEEDERIWKDIIRVIKGEISFTSEKANEEYIDWLESLKQRIGGKL